MGVVNDQHKVKARAKTNLRQKRKKGKKLKNSSTNAMTVPAERTTLLNQG